MTVSYPKPTFGIFRDWLCLQDDNGDSTPLETFVNEIADMPSIVLALAVDPLPQCRSIWKFMRMGGEDCLVENSRDFDYSQANYTIVVAQAIKDIIFAIDKSDDSRTHPTAFAQLKHPGWCEYVAVMQDDQIRMAARKMAVAHATLVFLKDCSRRGHYGVKGQLESNMQEFKDGKVTNSEQTYTHKLTSHRQSGR